MTQNSDHENKKDAFLFKQHQAMQIMYNISMNRLTENMKEEIMNTSQYYTPDIEDIRVGYECETRWANGVGVNGIEWKHLIVTDFHKWQLPTLRTPYLTKELMEAEGLDFGNSYLLIVDHSNQNEEDEVIRIGKRGDFRYGYNFKYRTLKITSEKDEQTVFNGNCPSINEFRTICKLLKIK